MESLPAYFTGILAVLLVTSFVKIVTTLSILRFGIGLHGAGFGLATIALALGLSFLVMEAQFEEQGGFEAAVVQAGEPGGREVVEQKFRPFLKKHAEPDIHEQFALISERLAEKSEVQHSQPAKERFGVLVASFLVSELKIAFQLGFLVVVPFLVLDLLVTNIMLALGVVQVSQAVIAVPLKILLFFALDGWFLVSERLFGTYL